MNRRVDIVRDTTSAARELISLQVSKSLVNLRGDLPDQIIGVLNGIDFSSTQLRTVPKLDSILREDYVNNLLDMLYVDLFVQYVDIFALQDHLTRVRYLTDSSIVSMVNRIGEIDSKVRDFTKLQEQQYAFTDVIHESFNTQNNQSDAGRRVDLNTSAGIARIGGTSTQFCSMERSNVSLSPISTGVRVLDTTDSEHAYGNDPTEPFYVTLTSGSFPQNTDSTLFQFGNYAGLIVDLIISFTGLMPITRVGFAPFANGPVTVIGAFAGDTLGATFDGTDLMEISLTEINYDNAEVEINFQRTYARELHVLLYLEKFMTPGEELEVTSTFGMDEYLTHCSHALKGSTWNGFTESEDITPQIAQLISGVRKNVELPVERLSANTRFYTIGLYNLKVYDVQYQVVGDYHSPVKKLRGNLAGASIAYDGDIYKKTASTIIDTVALFFVEIGNRELAIGCEDTDHWMVDANIIEQNLEFNQGNLVQSSTHPYKLRTHFIPDSEELDTIKLFSDGTELTLPLIDPSGIVITELDYGIDLKLPSDFTLDNGLYDGTVVTMKYLTADTDRFGRPYDTQSIDVLTVLGKPNLSDNTASSIATEYIYVANISSGVVLNSYSYDDTEYTPIMISGELHYCIYTGKGESAGSNILEINSKLYASNRTVVGPFDDFYYGSTSESPTDTGYDQTILSIDYDILATQTPYVKGTLKVYYDGYYVDSFIEYETDAYGIVLTNDEKCRFWVPQSVGPNVTVSYIPVDGSVVSETIGTNIAQHNQTERFLRTTNSRVKLSRYPYIDKSIVASPTFDLSGGVFSLRYKYSVTYEPIVVYVNGVKALNLTEYRSGKKPSFTAKKRQTDYQFYVENNNTIVLNEDVVGNIVVYYYVLSDSFSTLVRMYRSHYLRNDITPELFNYTLLANVQR